MKTKLELQSKYLYHIDWEIFPVFLLFILSFKIYYLIPLPGSLGINANVILPMLMCDLLLLLWSTRTINWLKKAYYGTYFTFLIFFLILEIFYTAFSYPDEPIFNAVKEFSTYTLLLSYFIFWKYGCKNYCKLLNFVVNSSSFLALLFVIQGVLYNLWEITFLQYPGFSYGQINLDFRNDRIRLVACDLISYTSILSMGRLLSKTATQKEKKWSAINIFLVFLYESYISQTRSMLLILLGVFVLTIIFAGIKNKKMYYLLILMILAITCIVVPFLIDFFNKVVDSLIYRTDWSVYHRFDSYAYYLSIMREKSIFGIGLLNDVPTVSQYFNLVHGKARYGYSDVGFIGVLGKLGITGAAFYLFPIAVTFKRTIRSFIHKKVDSMNLAIFLCMCFSMLNLSMFDAQRMVVLAIFMAVSDISYAQNVQKNTAFYRIS